MKKIILTFITAVATFSLQAQNINPGEGDHIRANNDAATSTCGHTNSLSGWCIDVNAMGGILNQQYIANSPVAAYTNPLNPNISNMQFNHGLSHGIEVQGGYFFGEKQNWGVGLGLMYLCQQGHVTMDNFHVEYASYDNFGNVFRQVVTANNQIKECLKISSFNVPIVLKYQTRCSEKVGFTADAGLLFNLHVQNNYKTNASFDYEAIYKYVGVDGSIATVYDDAATPASSDLLITKSQYLSSQPYGNIQNYFNSLKNDGYNVGLAEKPANNKGSVSYMSGSVGFLIRPAVSLYLCHNTTLNVGVYYYYQNFNNTAASNYHITDKTGEYSSMLNTVTNATNNSYGITVGVRYSFSKMSAPAPAVTEPAPAPEPEVEVASPVEVEEYHVDISTPLLFDVNKMVIKPSSIPILEEAVRELKENPNSILTIHGYSDNTGPAEYNKRLSRKRALVVKNYLKKKGVDPKILKTIGHGASNPAASNKTKEGRMRNRRVIMIKD
ncbi:MAG: OmpA family protein [Chitinophagales bacterium]